jgi:aspartyl-tRNA(Asn)/glutamyl-tRNA(Gln) amidotransferase subunit B
MSNYDKYELIVGLEVHIQLSTLTKAYCGDNAMYGATPNEYVSPLTLGHPGTLPVMNKNVINYAVKLGLATNCSITKYNEFARKNYFYADLPKGYQISQFKTPICTKGSFVLSNKNIGVTQIHMEEDAGKSIHDLDPFHSLIDLNRAGVPLLEIVTEPDFRTTEETTEYLTELRKLVRYLEICDGNMEEGSMRCDANISVRIKGDAAFNQRTEVKNINSIRNVKRAIESEFIRQIDELEAGNKIAQETRRFDPVTGKTLSLRSKENAHDYRYFPEPDLPPVVLTDEYISNIKASMPALAKELQKKFTTEFNLSEYDAVQITDDKAVAFYFNEIIQHTSNYKAAANWILGPIRSYINENALDIETFSITPIRIAELIKLTDDGKTNFSVASQKIFPEMLKDANKSALDIAVALNLIQNTDSSEIEQFCMEALAMYPDKVEEYKGGKKGVVGLFMGEVMKLSGGKADPKVASGIINKILNS